MKSKAWTEKVMQGVFFIAACTSVLAVALICIFLFANGIPAIRQIGFVKFVTGDIWRPGNELFGIFPMIIGSIYVTSNYIWCADRNSDFGIYGYVLPEENLQTVKSSN
jgi:phosphate transport system permease protein